MSSRVFDNQNATPTAPRRSPTYVEDTSNVPRRTSSRSSISDRLKNVFRRSSPSPNRTASNDRRPMSTISTDPQNRPTTTSGKPSNDAPQLRAPTISWPFGKKKSKSSSGNPTPKTSKKKAKAPQQSNLNSTSTMEISAPVYSQTNQRETFHPRTPETMRNTSERYAPLAPDYEGSSTRGFRDYVVIDKTQYSQQVVVSDVDNFTSYPHTSDRSRSPSMNRQRFANTTIEHSYYHDNSTGSMPIADVEIIPTPQQKRRAPDTPTSHGSRIVTEKPPIASRPISTGGVNPLSLNSTSSSTLNNPDARSTRSSTLDVSTPRLNAPTIAFGGGSNKKKDKRTRSQTRLDGMSTSSSTINKLAQQNPARPNEAWKSTYGSLPDAEIIYGGSSTSLQTSRNTANKYPGISAIVQHHMLRPPVTALYPNERIVPTGPIGTPGQRQRFDTSTTTLNQYNDNQVWPPPATTSPPSRHRQDGYIRPMTPTPPPKSSSQTDLSVIRVDIDDHGGRSPTTRPPRYTTPEPPSTYRSSTTIYTRDKHQYVDGGEIRTWSSQENNHPDDYQYSYRGQPYIHVQVDVKRAHQTDDYDRQYISSKTDDRFQEYRYSPRAHEEELYVREHKTLPDSEILEEERYEVSYEYEQQQHQQYSFENKSHYDQLNSAYRYTSEIDDDQNLTYANLATPSSRTTPPARTVAFSEREKVYDPPPRSYTESEHIQETYHSNVPVHHSEGITRTYRLRRSDSYDGLGMSVSANSETRSNHYIRDVESGSPADRAGLRVNDRIISINGTNVENVDFDDVLLLLKHGLDNDNLQLSVLHELDQI